MRNDVVQARSNECHGHDQEQLGYETGEKIIAQIYGKRFSEDLLRMNCEQFFERNEHDHQQQQPNAQPEDIGRERKQILLQLLEGFHANNPKIKNGRDPAWLVIRS